MYDVSRCCWWMKNCLARTSTTKDGVTQRTLNHLFLLVNYWTHDSYFLNTAHITSENIMLHYHYIQCFHRVIASAMAVCFCAVCPPHSFIRSFRQIMLPRYLINGSSNVSETYREYSPVPTDDLVRFWRSKVTTGRIGARVLKSIF